MGATGFDLPGWHYPRLALVVSTAGVLLVTALIFLFDRWRDRASISTVEDLIASGRATLVNHESTGSSGRWGSTSMESQYESSRSST